MIATRMRQAAAGGVPSSLLADLIAYWNLDEASGTRVDAHGNNDLSDNNTVTSTTGKVGDAATFVTANSEYLSRADNADLSVGNIDFTFDLWLNLSTAGTTRRIFGKGSGAAVASQYAYILQHASNRALQWIVSDGTTNVAVTSVEILTLGTWYYVRVWHDATNNLIGIQINNNTPTVRPHSTGSFNDTGTFYLGAGPGATVPVDGAIDEMGFWKRLLTDDEAAIRYNTGDGNTYPLFSGTGEGAAIMYGTATFTSTIDT